MFGEERDDMLELWGVGPRQVIHHLGQIPKTYSHLAVINRVDVLKRIDSRGLSPHHQRENDALM
jgi:hypothetical protein